MNKSDLQHLHGQSVLVITSENASRNPPVGVRGTLLIHAAPASADEPVAEISIALPDMFTERAREQIIPLHADELQQLLRTDHHGGYVWVLKEDLNPTVRMR